MLGSRAHASLDEASRRGLQGVAASAVTAAQQSARIKRQLDARISRLPYNPQLGAQVGYRRELVARLGVPIEAMASPYDEEPVKLAHAHPALHVNLHLGNEGPSVRRREVDVSLYESALAWMTVLVANYSASGELPIRS